VTAYLVFVYALFSVQGGMWSESVHIPPCTETKHTQFLNLF
jgi:hypothetical protein